MSKLGNKNFLEEQTTVAGMGAFIDDEDQYQAYQGNMTPASSMSAKPAASFTSQSMTTKPGTSVTSSGYRPSQRGFEIPGEDEMPEEGTFNPDVFNPGDPSTFPVSDEEYQQFWDEWWMPNMGEMYQTMFLLTGTNSISGLSGMLGMPVTGDPQTDANAFIGYMFDFNKLPYPFGFCWACEDFGDLGGEENGDDGRGEDGRGEVDGGAIRP